MRILYRICDQTHVCFSGWARWRETARRYRRARRRICGLLARRSLEAVSITYVGKESNLPEDVENEIVHDWDEVQQRYEDNRLDFLNDVLKKIPSKELAKAARISERAIRAIRNGHSRHRRQPGICCCGQRSDSGDNRIARVPDTKTIEFRRFVWWPFLRQNVI